MTEDVTPVSDGDVAASGTAEDESKAKTERRIRGFEQDYAARYATDRRFDLARDFQHRPEDPETLMTGGVLVGSGRRGEEVGPSIPVLVRDAGLDVEAGPGTRVELIEGDNLLVLAAMLGCRREHYDVCLTDVPYNTGGEDFVYNDRIVDAEDGWRHSKYVSFMYRRFRLLWHTLKDRGVLLVHCDDNEMHNLRHILDDVFGEGNRLATMVWDGGRKNDSRYVSVGHDYVLAYAKDESLLAGSGIRFRVRKDGLNEIYAAVRRFVALHGDCSKASKEMKSWYKELPEGHPAKRHSYYWNIDERHEELGPYRISEISWPGGGGPRYDVPHPVTGKPCAVPSRGWIYSTPEKFQELVDEGRIVFGIDESYVPNRKTYLRNTEGEAPKSVFYRDRAAANRVLAQMFPEVDGKLFDFPKDTDETARLLSMAEQASEDPARCCILDIFAGSGSTAAAVMRLNAADGGCREVTLVQIGAEMERGGKPAHVTLADGRILTRLSEATRERVRRELDGYRGDKPAVAGLGGTLECWHVGLAPYRPSAYEDAFCEAALGTLMLRSGTPTLVEHVPGLYAIAEGGGRRMFASFRLADEGLLPVLDKLRAIQQDGHELHAYLFTVGGLADASILEDVPAVVSVEALPRVLETPYEEAMGLL